MPHDLKLLTAAIRMAVKEPMSVSQKSLANLLGAREIQPEKPRTA